MKRKKNASQNTINIDSSEDDQNPKETENQLVVYDPGNVETEIAPTNNDTTPSSISRSTPRVLPAVGAFTVQCADCFKWRLIPSKEKYEEIREHILDNPFYCQTARTWRPEISCNDPPDVSQDGSHLWAIDKPSIAQPPPGWQRSLRIRGEGCTKFADVYYRAPSGKRLRSMVEIEKYLQKNPEYKRQGVRKTQFSFQIPRPLQENYVRKRQARAASDMLTLEGSEVNALAWVNGDEEDLNLQGGGTGSSNSYDVEPGNVPRRRRTASLRSFNQNNPFNHSH